ncbi:MAG: CBS domain-containing protein [Limnothrix sp. BL-A-16]
MFEIFKKLTNSASELSSLDSDLSLNIQSSPIDVCISYGENESFWAKIIEKSFCDLEQQVLLTSKSVFLNTEFLTQPKAYVSFLPNDYGCLSLDKSFDEEILKALSFSKMSSLLLIYDVERNSDEVLNALVQSIELARADVSVNMIDISIFSEESLITITSFLKESVDMVCTSAKDTIKDLMTSAKDLVTVRSNQNFSDLYYRMMVKGVRHIPILAPEGDECLGIASRRDIADQLPPSNDDLDQLQNSLINLDRTKLNRILLSKGMEKISSVFPHLGTGTLVYLSPESMIEEAIGILCEKQRIGAGRLTYVSGVLVLDKNKQLKGFVSYTDILRKFIKGQEDFLHDLKVHQVALMGSAKIDCLNNAMDLSLAKMASDVTKRRSFPVLESGETDIEKSDVVGFLEDIKIKKYVHPEFPELGEISVSEMMTKVEHLPCIPKPDDKVADILDSFWKPFYGNSPASSFLVCDKKDSKLKLRGVISYVDILRFWLKWRDDQCENLPESN